ncbi:MAG: hypothetical protein ABR863_08175 [Roseiarcus sp.]
MTASRIVELAELDLALVARPWPFAEAEAAAIAAHWRTRLAAKPRLYNGRVLLLGEHALERRADGAQALRGAFFETDYAAFIAWRDFGYPDAQVCNAFSAAALASRDGAFLLGEMAAHTLNAGAIYFPCGTPDPKDVFAGRVDLEQSAARELEEEGARRRVPRGRPRRRTGDAAHRARARGHRRKAFAALRRRLSPRRVRSKPGGIAMALARGEDGRARLGVMPCRTLRLGRGDLLLDLTVNGFRHVAHGEIVVGDRAIARDVAGAALARRHVEVLRRHVDRTGRRRGGLPREGREIARGERESGEDDQGERLHRDISWRTRRLRRDWPKRGARQEQNAAGTPNAAFRLTPADLLRLTGGTKAAIAR